MTKITIDDLAIMVAKGFADNAEKFGVLHNDMHTLKQDVQNLKETVSTLEEKTDSLASGQIRILDILLNQTASRAEVRELDHRVVRLEQHLQLA